MCASMKILLLIEHNKSKSERERERGPKTVSLLVLYRIVPDSQQKIRIERTASKETKQVNEYLYLFSYSE